MNGDPLGVIESIQRRRSVRTFDPGGLTSEEACTVRSVLAAAPMGPFGGRPRFELLDLEAMPPGERARLGTYGMIRNARHFFAGAVKKQGRAHEDFGYAMEAVILRLTAWGMGTCWLGGSFRRKRVARAIDLRGDEDLPAASPVGRPAEKRGVVQSVLAGVVRARRRMGWAELFHLGEEGAALDPSGIGAYAGVLECVRIGPSAANRQPWRIIKGPGAYHLFLRRTPGYALLTSTDLQRLDMGIAMLHFQAAAQELGLSGGWRAVEAEKLPRTRWEYIATWEDEGEGSTR